MQADPTAFSNTASESNAGAAVNASTFKETATTNQVNPETTNVDSKLNMAFMEDRNTVEESGRTAETVNTLTSRIKGQMPDSYSWQAADFLKRPMQIANFIWNSTQTRGQVIWNIRYPQAISSFTGLHQQILRNFTYFRYNGIKLRFELNSTKFHAGKLSCNVVPFNCLSTLPNTSGKYQKEQTLYTLLMCARGDLNASESNVVELGLPFQSPLNFIDTINKDTYDNLFSVNVFVVNPLRTGTTQCLDPVSVNVYVEFVDPYLSLPVADHDLVWSTPAADLASSGFYRNSDGSYKKLDTQTEEEFREKCRETERRLLEEIAKKDEERRKKEIDRASSGLITTLSQGYEAISDIAANIKTGNFSAAVGTGASYVAKVLGYDKPLTKDPLTSCLHPIPTLAHSKGILTGVRLSLLPDSAAVIAPEYAGAKDEMDWNKIIQVRSLIKQITWATTATSGTQLFSIPLTPQVRQGSLYDDGNHYVSENTYLSYASEMFCYWSGPIDFTFEFVSTSFHTGRFLMVFNPDTDPTATLSFDDARNLPQVVLDIQKSSTFTVRVPFYSNVRYKSIYNKLRSSSFAQPANCLTGYLHVYVLNPLRAPCNVSPDIEVNLYISAGEGFALSTPMDNMNGQRTYIAPALKYNLNNQVDFSELYDEDWDEVDKASSGHISSSLPAGLVDTTGRTKTTQPSQVLGFGNGITDTGNIAGEPFSIKDLLARWTPIETGSDGTPTLFTAPTLFINATPKFWGYNHAADNSLSDSLVSRISELWAAWSGSLRYMFLFGAPRTTNQMVNLSYNPMVAGYDYNSFVAAHMTTLSQMNGMTVEVPFATRFNLLITGPDYLDDPGHAAHELSPVYAGGLVFTETQDPGAENRLSYTVWTSVGDDFSFHTLVPPTRTYGVPEAQNVLPLFLITTLS